MTLRSADEHALHAPGGPFGAATPMEVIDLLLWLLVERSGTVTVVPDVERSAHVLRYERAGTSFELGIVPAGFGDALAARLAIVAGLPVGVPGMQFGRLLPVVEAPVPELLAAVRTTPAGLEAEVHTMATGAPPSDDDASPESLAEGHGRVGMYRVNRILGHGGMGVVYLAEHVALQKLVALKVLHAESAHDRRHAAQFLVEARAACRARHPGIVDVTDFGTLRDGRSYLVMEYITWPTLAQVLAPAPNPLPVERAVTILRHVAEGLAAAAAHGVVHRDLTPSNIFVGENDATKIADFGLARIADVDSPSRPGPGGIGGTVGYMAPEQWTGGPTDTRSDIYSLGVILFRMLTGRMPFSGNDPLELLHREYTWGPPLAIGPDGPFPEPLQRIIQRAMATRTSERYQTAEELLLSLDDFARTQRHSGWTRRRVLVVDDEEEVCEAFTRLLGAAHDVVAVTSGTQALLQLRSSVFDLVFCDLMIARDDGDGSFPAPAARDAGGHESDRFHDRGHLRLRRRGVSGERRQRAGRQAVRSSSRGVAGRIGLVAN